MAQEFKASCLPEMSGPTNPEAEGLEDLSKMFTSPRRRITGRSCAGSRPRETGDDMRHHHGGISTAIAWGIGMALGFMLLHAALGLAVLAIVGIFAWTKNWSSSWRGFVRGAFVTMLVLSALLGLVLIFSE
jgi:hypothetical protein